MLLQIRVDEGVFAQHERVEVEFGDDLRRKIVLQEASGCLRSRKGLFEELIVWIAQLAHEYIILAYAPREQWRLQRDGIMCVFLKVID